MLKDTANLDLSIWPTAIKSLDPFALLRSIMTKETFGVSAHFMKINDKKLIRGLSLYMLRLGLASLITPCLTISITCAIHELDWGSTRLFRYEINLRHREWPTKA